jgi:hypothetical protein
VSGYHSIARDIGRRPRRLPCFTVTSLFAAACLGAILGTAATATIMGARQPVLQHATCVLRGQDAEGLLPARYAPLTGVCEVRR